MTVSGRAFKAAFGGAESSAEAILANRCERHGLPKPEMQALLIPSRKFRWDLAWPAYRVCVDVQGGMYSNGRHLRVQGYETDLVKSALVQLEGYIALAFTPRQIDDNVAVMFIAAALAAHGWKT